MLIFFETTGVVVDRKLHKIGLWGPWVERAVIYGKATFRERGVTRHEPRTLVVDAVRGEQEQKRLQDQRAIELAETLERTETEREGEL